MSDEIDVSSESTLRGQKKHGHSRIAFVSLLAVLSLLAIGAIALYAACSTGHIYMGVKDTNQRVSLGYQVCGDDIVKKYNMIGLPMTDAGLEIVKSLTETIDKNANSIHDPTCQVIRFYVASESKDLAKMKDALDQLRGLYNKGEFANNNLQSTASVSVMERVFSDMQSGR